jgi:hypothetical protein
MDVEKPKSALSESSSPLQFNLYKKQRMVLKILTSSVSGEGKFCSINIATVLH